MFKKIIAVSLASSFMVGVAFAGKKEVPQFIEGTVRVSAEEMIELVEKYDDLVIIDARKKSDVAKGFIEGSVSIPNTETTAASLASAIPSKSTPVAFYCNGIKCGRSVKSAKIALAEGYSKIFWFRGGMQEWEAKGLPLVHP
jgi:rhodanese-related sulfurtransferase